MPGFAAKVPFRLPWCICQQVDRGDDRSNGIGDVGEFDAAKFFAGLVVVVMVVRHSLLLPPTGTTSESDLPSSSPAMPEFCH